MSSCLLSGLPDDPLVDAEVWRYDLVLGTPAQGDTPAKPFDVTGSDLTIVMRTLSGWEPVSTLSTNPDWPGLDGTITITEPGTSGALSIVSDPWLRKYRVPILRNWIGPPVPVQVRGDVLRLLKDNPESRPEYLGFIQFPLRASTTQWPAPVS